MRSASAFNRRGVFAGCFAWRPSPQMVRVLVRVGPGAGMAPASNKAVGRSDRDNTADSVVV
jgi:hypothetical protein